MIPRCPCGEPVLHENDHPGECCDCADLGWGMPLEQLNKERVKAGKPPLKERWTVSRNTE